MLGEDEGALGTVRTRVAAHVLDNAGNGQADLVAEGDLAAHIIHRQVLLLLF